MNTSNQWEPEDAHLVASPESVERSPRVRLGSWLATLAAGVLAGFVVGWALRGSVSSHEGFVAGADRASASGSKNMADDHAVPRYAFQQPTFLSPEREVTAATPMTTKPIKSSTPVKPSVAPPKAVVPMVGSLKPLTPAVATPLPSSADLHSAEAKVRTIASDLGAHVVAVHDARGSADSAARSIVLSIAPTKVDALTDRVRKELGSAAMVEPPAPSMDSADTSSIELKSEETVLEQLKQRLRQANLDFYPDAPAVKSLQAQYADELKKVEGLRRSNNTPVSVTVVLVGTPD